MKKVNLSWAGVVLVLLPLLVVCVLLCHRRFGKTVAAVNDLLRAALRAGTVDRAVVPIENSVEGGVPSTLDALSAGDPLTAQRAYEMNSKVIQSSDEMMSTVNQLK